MPTVLPTDTTTDPFITVTDVADYLGRSIAADAAAWTAVEAACDLCRDEAEQFFTLNTIVETYDGTGSDALVLKQMPVATVGTVVVNGGTVTDYRVSDAGVLTRGTTDSSYGWWYSYPYAIWPRGRQNITVTYSAGYAEVPDRLKQVAITVAARMIAQGVASQEQVGDVNVKYSTDGPLDLTANEQRILRRLGGH